MRNAPTPSSAHSLSWLWQACQAFSGIMDSRPWSHKSKNPLSSTSYFWPRYFINQQISHKYTLLIGKWNKHTQFCASYQKESNFFRASHSLKIVWNSNPWCQYMRGSGRVGRTSGGGQEDRFLICLRPQKKINGLNDAEHKGSKSSTQVLRRRGIIGKDTEVKQELAAWPAQCYA